METWKEVLSDEDGRQDYLFDLEKKIFQYMQMIRKRADEYRNFTFPVGFLTMLIFAFCSAIG